MNFIYYNGLLKKSNNTVSKIMNRYVFAIIPFLILTIIYNIYSNNNYNIFITILMTNIICIFTQYVINLIKKDYNIKYVFTKDNILILSLLLSIFTINLDNIFVLIISIIVTIFKNILNINNKAILIGLILINIYKIYYLNLELPLYSTNNIPVYNDIIKYSSLKNYLLGFNPYYLSPILSIIIFIYLFHKKSIKYIIPISIILTYSFIIATVGIIKDLPLWYLLFNIITGNIVFLSVMIATDYINTPITFEGSLIYGILIGILTAILRYIVPELSISISILVISLLTSLLDKISFKLKYKSKFYILIIILLILLVIASSIVLGIIL